MRGHHPHMGCIATVGTSSPQDAVVMAVGTSSPHGELGLVVGTSSPHDGVIVVTSSPCMPPTREAVGSHPHSRGWLWGAPPHMAVCVHMAVCGAGRGDILPTGGAVGWL